MSETAAYAFEMIGKLSGDLGIRLELEPHYNYAGELVFPNGHRSLVLGRNFNLNPSASGEIVKDKAFTNYFLKKRGFRVPDGCVFFSLSLNKKLPPQKRAGIDEAIAYAARLGYPVFVKPNNSSQGRLVTKVFDAKSLRTAAEKIFKLTDILLVEKLCVGNDYRVVVLGGEIISVYERVPAFIFGDGKTSIERLLQEKRKVLRQADRKAEALTLHDFRVVQSLKMAGLNPKSVLRDGMKLQLLPNANISTGGSAVEFAPADIHPSFAKAAVRAAQALNLEFCGVDFIAKDITKSLDKQKWWILELNGNCQLNSRAGTDDEQSKRMAELYKKILKYLLKKHSVSPRRKK